ncbi:MAG: hypothetical protein J0H71_15820 [Rhizobiales bacterium]|nr:hypothetical protein [Hyphomicrobiales bacterium]
MVKLVAFTSLAAPATASTIAEVSPLEAVGIADACAEVAIAAAAMLNGAVLADPEPCCGDVGTGAVSETVVATTAMAVGSNVISGADAIAASASVVRPELAFAESSAAFTDFVCFDDLPVSCRECSLAAVLSVFREGVDEAATGSVVVSRDGLRSWEGMREEACGVSWRSGAVGRAGSAVALASTSAPKPFDCGSASGARVRGGSGRMGVVALDSDVTLNTGTSAHETETYPAKNRPVLMTIKIVIYQ